MIGRLNVDVDTAVAVAALRDIGVSSAEAAAGLRAMAERLHRAQANLAAMRERAQSRGWRMNSPAPTLEFSHIDAMRWSPPADGEEVPRCP